MPLYTYLCDCGAEKEIVHGMLEEPVIECDNCTSIMKRIIYPCSGRVSTPRTVGMLADRNADKMSEDEKQFRKQLYKTKKVKNAT